MPVTIPPQSVPFADGVTDDQNAPAIFDKTWWLAFNSAFDLINSLSRAGLLNVPFITPEQFGATGDGSTDDTAKLQAAFSDGRAIMMREGAVYLVSSLTLNSGTVVFGLPGATIRQKGGSAVNNTPFISATTITGIYMVGITIDGNKAAQPGITGVAGLYLTDVTNAEFVDCTVMNTTADAWGGVGWRNFTFQTPHASNWGIGNGFAGIYLRPTGTRTTANIFIFNPQLDGTGSGSCIKLQTATACQLTNVQVIGGSVTVGSPSTGPTDALAVECFSADDGIYVQGVLVDGVSISSEFAPALSYGKSWAVSLSRVQRGQVVNCRVQGTGFYFIELIGSELLAKNNHGTNVGEVACIVSSVILNPQNTIEIAANTSVTCSNVNLGAVHVYIEGASNLSRVSIHDNDLTIQGTTQKGVWIQNNGSAILLRPTIQDNSVFGDGSGGQIAYHLDNDSTGTIQRALLSKNYAQNIDTMISRGAGTVNSRILENIPGPSVSTVYGGTPGTGEMIIDIANTEGVNFAPPGIQMRGRAAAVIEGNGDIYLDQVSSSARLGTAHVGIDSNPNPLYLNRVNFGSTAQGTIISVNSYFNGFPNWALGSDGSISTQALFAVFAAQQFRIKFGAAANALGGDPGIDAFRVVAGDAVYSGAGYPIDVESSGARVFAGNGTPNGVISAPVGSFYLDLASGAYLKTGGGSGNTGWVSVSTGGAGITQLTGDVTAGPGSGSQAATLAASGVSASTYGDSTHVAQITVDAKGRLTAASNVAISGGGGAVSSVFGRTGAVVATSGDYTVSQVTGAAATGGGVSVTVHLAKLTGGGSNGFVEFNSDGVLVSFLDPT